MTHEVFLHREHHPHTYISNNLVMKSNGKLSIMKLFPGMFQQQFIAGLLHTAILVVKVKHTRAPFACKWKLSHRKQKKRNGISFLFASGHFKIYYFKERFLVVASDGFIY